MPRLPPILVHPVSTTQTPCPIFNVPRNPLAKNGSKIRSPNDLNPHIFFSCLVVLKSLFFSTQRFLPRLLTWPSSAAGSGISELLTLCRVSSRQPRSFCFGKRTQNHFGPVLALRVPCAVRQLRRLRNSLRSNSARRKPRSRLHCSATPEGRSILVKRFRDYLGAEIISLTHLQHQEESLEPSPPKRDTAPRAFLSSTKRWCDMTNAPSPLTATWKYILPLHNPF